MKLGFLGFGSIASAVAEGCVADGHSLRISSRSRDRATAMADAYENVEIADNQDIVDFADVVMIGTTAEIAPSVLKELEFCADQIVISFMVGMDPETLDGLIAPAKLDAIMIPFPSIAEGNSPVIAYPQSDTIDALFGARNTIVSVKTEAALNDYLAAQAILSPSVQMLITAVDWLAARTGDGHGAEQFLRLLVGGSLLGKPMDTRDVLSGIIQALSTPGGLNQQFREHMQAEGAFEAAERGLEALARRMSGS